MRSLEQELVVDYVPMHRKVRGRACIKRLDDVSDLYGDTNAVAVAGVAQIYHGLSVTFIFTGAVVARLPPLRLW